MANKTRVRRCRERRAAQHRRRCVDAQQAERLHPFAEPAVEVDVDAREAARVQARQVRDQRLRAVGIGRHHRPDRMAAAEAAQHAEAARLLLVVEHDGGVGLRDQIGDQRAARHAARLLIRACKRLEIALTRRPQPPAGIEGRPAASATRCPGAGAFRRCERSPVVRRDHGPSEVACSSTVCRVQRRRAARSSGGGRCAGPGMPARRSRGPSVACRSPQRQRKPVPTSWPSRSATRPSPWRKASSQSAGRCGQRSSVDSACAAARSDATIGRSCHAIRCGRVRCIHRYVVHLASSRFMSQSLLSWVQSRRGATRETAASINSAASSEQPLRFAISMRRERVQRTQMPPARA